MRIYWPNKISNYELRRKTCARPVSLEVNNSQEMDFGIFVGGPRQQSRGWICAGLQMEKESEGDPGRQVVDQLNGR